MSIAVSLLHTNSPVNYSVCAATSSNSLVPPPPHLIHNSGTLFVKLIQFQIRGQNYKHDLTRKLMCNGHAYCIKVCLYRRGVCTYNIYSFSGVTPNGFPCPVVVEPRPCSEGVCMASFTRGEDQLCSWSV